MSVPFLKECSAPALHRNLYRFLFSSQIVIQDPMPRRLMFTPDSSATLDLLEKSNDARLPLVKRVLKYLESGNVQNVDLVTERCLGMSVSGTNAFVSMLLNQGPQNFRVVWYQDTENSTVTIALLYVD